MSDRVPVEAPTRLSTSVLWDLQRRYFEQRGLEAWDAHEVPHYVTTNAFIAHAYARVLLAYAEDAARHDQLDLDAPIEVIELGAGSGRLGFLLARELAALAPARDLPPFRVILTDFTEANVDGWARRPEFGPLLERGAVDFAVYDADHPGPLRLRHSGEVLDAGDLRNPLGIVANYVVDTLRQDAWAIKDGALHAIEVQAGLPEGVPVEATDAIEHVSLRRTVRPLEGDAYDEPFLAHLMERYRGGLSDSEILVPVGALRAVEHLLGLAGGRACMLVGDKGYRRLADLDGRRIGGLVKHGSFSMMANLDALAERFGRAGGASLTHGNRYTRFTLASFATLGEGQPLPRWGDAFAEQIDGFGPAEYHRFYKMVRRDQKDAPLPMILLLLRLSRFDPVLFERYAPRILAEVEEASRAVRQDVALCIAEVLRRAYPVGAKDDPRFIAGRILFRCERFAEAALVFEKVCKARPGRRAAWFNLGLSRERLADPSGARAAYARALEIDPDYDRPREALARLEA